MRIIKTNQIPSCMNKNFIFISLISLMTGCLDPHDKVEPVINGPDKVNTDTLDINFYTSSQNVDEIQVPQITLKSDEGQITAIGNASKILNRSDKNFVCKLSDQMNKITDEEIFDDLSQASNETQTSDKFEFDGSNMKFDIDLLGHLNTQNFIDRQFINDRCFRFGSVSSTFL